MGRCWRTRYPPWIRLFKSGISIRIEKKKNGINDTLLFSSNFWTLCAIQTINQSIDQSNNHQSPNQSFNQWINPPINHPINQSINQWKPKTNNWPSSMWNNMEWKGMKKENTPVQSKKDGIAVRSQSKTQDRPENSTREGNRWPTPNDTALCTGHDYHSLMQSL